MSKKYLTGGSPGPAGLSGTVSGLEQAPSSVEESSARIGLFGSTKIDEAITFSVAGGATGVKGSSGPGKKTVSRYGSFGAGGMYAGGKLDEAGEFSGTAYAASWTGCSCM